MVISCGIPSGTGDSAISPVPEEAVEKSQPYRHMRQEHVPWSSRFGMARGQVEDVYDADDQFAGSV